MPRVLILGASGQLGLELQRAQTPADWIILPASREDLDLADTSSLARGLTAFRPDAIINAAAYTAVDQAEAEPDLAFRLNRDAPAALAAASAAIGATFVHISTDYVFGGDKDAPYTEDDPRRPINVYGHSKAAGEIAVLEAYDRAAIVRTSWLFSPYRANFLRTMVRLGHARDEVSVVTDQIGRPTAAADLASACVELTKKLLDSDKGATGIFHYAGAGDVSWADFAEAIFAEAIVRGRAPVRVKRIGTADYQTIAKRPANSRLDTSKIEALGITPRPWREGVRVCLDELLPR